MKKSASLVLLLVMPALFAGCGQSDEKLEVLWSVPAFKLTKQDGQAFGSEQLKGKTWIATLFFTSCVGPCPMMADRLSDIQSTMNDPDVVLVSLSCDPDNDTPQRLQAYAQAHHADPNKWFFLTGEPADVKALAMGLKLSYDPATKDGPITHSTKFLLIDKQGAVRGLYSYDDDASMDQLKKDAPRLAREG
jgi:protein SCO1/2